MKRSEMIENVKTKRDKWDIIIIGGGATGLGTAVDAASRGYETLLLEMNDFAHGTSSKSTKLIHGGVRYLQQGNVSLVIEALKERGILMKNAPHLVHSQRFLVPHFTWWKGFYYWIGLKLYDILAGKLGIGTSRHLSADKTMQKLVNLKSENLSGGVLYYDGQFDDSRFAINLAKTGVREGGTLINYMKVTDLIKEQDNIAGVKAVDLLQEEEYEIRGKAVVNATGVFTDSILKLDDPTRDPIITPSQGIHIVVDKDFLMSDTGILIPETSDGRVLFILPWYDRVMIGTTDTPVDKVTNEPKALDEEINYLLKHTAEYLDKSPSRSDIRSVFAGLRPLVDKDKKNNKDTASISREHTLFATKSGLVTIAGGKWTTYRKMAKKVVERAVTVSDLNAKKCVTEELRIQGWEKSNGSGDPMEIYGSDKSEIQRIINQKPELAERIHDRLPYIKAEVIWATRNEMAMTIEDFISRRTRALFLDVKASIEMAPEVARLMAEEAGHSREWIQEQVRDYTETAKSYQVSP